MRAPGLAYSRGDPGIELRTSTEIRLNWRSYGYVCIVESLLSVYGAFPKHQNIKVMELKVQLKSNSMKK